MKTRKSQPCPMLAKSYGDLFYTPISLPGCNFVTAKNKAVFLLTKCCCFHKIVFTAKNKAMICRGNHMDESAIWEKIARSTVNCTRRS